MVYPPPDWRAPADYAWLLEAGAGVVAWEWLRRSEAYQLGWDRHGASANFGLVQCEPPWLDARDALPLQSRNADPAVLAAAARAPEMGTMQVEQIVDFAAEGLLLRQLSLAGIQHLLLGKPVDPVRVDLIGASESTGPVVLQWQLTALGTALPALETLRRIVTLRAGLSGAAAATPAPRIEREVLMIRCADALADGASHQEIARGLFEPLVAQSRWRLEAGSVRLRVQRLVRAARARMDHAVSALPDPWSLPNQGLLARSG